jgi:hypothetical protein
VFDGTQKQHLFGLHCFFDRLVAPCREPESRRFSPGRALSRYREQRGRNLGRLKKRLHTNDLSACGSFFLKTPSASMSVELSATIIRNVA